MAFMKVDGVTIKTPSSFKWGKQDISGPNAGRTLDSIMHKNRVAEKRKLTLSWNGLSPEETSAVLRAFEPEYVEISYPDALGGNVQARTFYTGDMEADMYSWTVNKKIYKQIAFSVIER